MMAEYLVIVRKDGMKSAHTTIATCTADAMAWAYDVFGVCGVSARPV